MLTPQVRTCIERIPKAELHVHIEGTLEPELMFSLAKRNGIPLPYGTVEDVRAAYDFHNLQDFLDIYYAGAAVLIHEQDFYDLTMAYMTKVHGQNVVHAEIFFDPQSHTDRGISFETAITGIHRALHDAETSYGMTSRLIPCFLRHLTEDAALKTLEDALPYKDWITAFGLDSSEVGHPPSKFARVFTKARALGYKTVAHAGEEGPPEYVWEALQLLGVSRVDHGNRSLLDEDLVHELVKNRIPLTVCPLSNLKLKVISAMHDHPLRTMMQKGLLVTINSDDPAYFGGYIQENYLAVADALDLTVDDIIRLAENAFHASFLSDAEKEDHCARVRSCKT